MAGLSSVDNLLDYDFWVEEEVTLQRALKSKSTRWPWAMSRANSEAAESKPLSGLANGVVYPVPPFNHDVASSTTIWDADSFSEDAVESNTIWDAESSSGDVIETTIIWDADSFSEDIVDSTILWDADSFSADVVEATILWEAESFSEHVEAGCTTSLRTAPTKQGPWLGRFAFWKSSS